MTDQFHNKSLSNNDNQNGEIDLKDLMIFIFRNKTLISTIVILSFLVSIILSIFKPKTWQGEFDIVLVTQQDKSIPQGLEILSSALMKNNQENNALLTEVAILESKSVLMPIFNYVQTEKLKTKNEIELDFKSWKKDSLKISLIDETSILNISYRDKDKNLIMPVLKKISNEYQKYSGKVKRRNNSLAKNYLNQQINIFKNKSLESLKAVQEFAIEQNLQMIDTTNSQNFDNRSSTNIINQRGQTRDNQFFISNAGIEVTRVGAVNRIKNIDILLDKIKNNSKRDVAVYSGLPIQINQSEIFSELDDLDKQIIDLKSKYKDSDPYLIRLINTRNSLFELIEKRSIGFLENERIKQESILEASKRPKGVILKYKELLRYAMRDEATLVNLENQLRLVNLEDARVEDPWELISNPTLNEKHIFPKKSVYGLIGGFFGLFIGLLLSFIKEKKSDLVLNQKHLEKILGIEIIDNFDPINKKLLNYSHEIFIKEILKFSKNSSYKIINLGNLSKVESKGLLDCISDEKINFFYENTFDFQDSKSEYLIVAKMGTFTNKQLKVFKSRLYKSQNKIIGIIII